MFSNDKPKGIFSMKSKNLCKKNHGGFFNETQPTRVKSEKFRFSKLYLIKKLKVQVQMNENWDENKSDQKYYF